jgi:hypothetical protein
MHWDGAGSLFEQGHENKRTSHEKFKFHTRPENIPEHNRSDKLTGKLDDTKLYFALPLQTNLAYRCTVLPTDIPEKMYTFWMFITKK